jgi:hypothetical protein
MWDDATYEKYHAMDLDFEKYRAQEAQKSERQKLQERIQALNDSIAANWEEAGNVPNLLHYTLYDRLQQLKAQLAKMRS